MYTGNPFGESTGQRPRVVLIAGPTASGKSDIAAALAQKTAATIINADASQVYADIPILSAAPSAQEHMAVPHALYGYLSASDNCSAARWAEDAKTAIAESLDAGRLPILVGGTGLYLRTLLKGISPIPEIDSIIRAEVRAMATDAAWAALKQEDWGAAARLNAQDTTRIARALEVVRSTGEPISYWQNQTVGGIEDDISLCPILLLPPRDWLYDRCDARFEAMIEAGALDEVRHLMHLKLPEKAPILGAIGMRELRAVLNGDMGMEQAKDSAQQATRNYAKRQYTWFRNQCPQDWERWIESINNQNINKIVIKLLNMVLT
jgi:tRNA dimethylallyltransferase